MFAKDFQKMALGQPVLTSHYRKRMSNALVFVYSTV